MEWRTTSDSLTSSPICGDLHEWLCNAIQALIQESLSKGCAGVCYEDGIAVTWTKAAA